jgi:hypothetical protein
MNCSAARSAKDACPSRIFFWNRPVRADTFHEEGGPGSLRASDLRNIFWRMSSSAIVMENL